MAENGKGWGKQTLWNKISHNLGVSTEKALSLAPTNYAPTTGGSPDLSRRAGWYRGRNLIGTLDESHVGLYRSLPRL